MTSSSPRRASSASSSRSAKRSRARPASAAACAPTTPSSENRAKRRSSRYAQLGCITALDAEITELDTELQPLVATAAPRTTALLGISTGHASQLLLTAGQNITRLHSEAAFAALCGASPIPVASGKHGRYRLNPGGDRQANRALHMIAVCRLRYCPKTRAYAERRTTEGKTKKDILRCLKRYIAREVYNTLRHDLKSLSITP